MEVVQNRIKEYTSKKADRFSAGRPLSISDWMGHPLTFIILSVFTLLCSILIIKFGILPAVMLPALFILIPSLYAIIVFPRFGIIMLMICSYFIMIVLKTGLDFPVGTIMDALEFLLIIGFFIKHKYSKDWKFAKNPISLMILIWIVYNFMEVLNPAAESMMAWLYTIRTVAIVMLTYFIFTYYITSLSFLKLILKIWIALSLLAALYTLKQEYFGFFSFEKQWLANDPGASALYFIGGHWRKFSFFSDPVALAYNMVASSLLCIAMLFGPLPVYKKVVLCIVLIFLIMAMLYSGTRGAFILIPVGVAFLFLLKFNRKILIAGLLFAAAFVFMIKVPTSNGTILRFQSAFYPSSDASFNVRAVNQKRIQPYIQSHPIGGGLGSTGVWGQRFAPNSYLASFPPDSGYVRVAVETGWIGLLIFCSLMFVILKTGIKNYYKIKNAELKNYCLAMVLIVFALGIGNYPQEAFVQFPINIYFYLVIALIIVTRRIDNGLRESTLEPALN